MGMRAALRARPSKSRAAPERGDRGYPGRARGRPRRWAQAAIGWMLLAVIGLAMGWWIDPSTAPLAPVTGTGPAAVAPDWALVCRSLNCRSGVTNTTKRKLIVDTTTGVNDPSGGRAGADVVMT
jgi:hypothetical protein